MAPLLPTANPLASFGPHFMWIALVVAVLAIPQVRHSMLCGVDRVRDYFYGPPASAAAVTEGAASEPAADPGFRREIEEFDLSIFETAQTPAQP